MPSRSVSRPHTLLPRDIHSAQGELSPEEAEAAQKAAEEAIAAANEAAEEAKLEDAKKAAAKQAEAHVASLTPKTPPAQVLQDWVQAPDCELTLGVQKVDHAAESAKWEAQAKKVAAAAVVCTLTAWWFAGGESCGSVGTRTQCAAQFSACQHGAHFGSYALLTSALLTSALLTSALLTCAILSRILHSICAPVGLTNKLLDCRKVEQVEPSGCYFLWY